MIAFLVALAIAVAVSVVSYLITPKAKQARASKQVLSDPTNDAGREVAVVFGEGVIKAPNILWFGDKSTRDYKIKA